MGVWNDNIPMEQGLTTKKIKILGNSMSYITAGQPTNKVFVFIHGNPTRAYLWRNIMPYLAALGTTVAPDLIGMGDSDKLTNAEAERYTFKCHERYLNEFIQNVVPKDKMIVLIGHDWGGVLSHNWARHNRQRVAGICFMETFLEPHISGQTPEYVIKWFMDFRGEKMTDAVIQNNHFVETVFLKNLPQLTEQDRLIYRTPFMNAGDDRLPTLIWPQEAPIDGTPQYTTDVFVKNMDFMGSTKIPKLFVNATPGALLGNEARRKVIRTWPSLTEVAVPGNHYIQEQCPTLIGEALVKWAKNI
jgi:haloalkane dehalogenase